MQTLSPELRTWIAENLISGCATQSLVDGLTGIGVTEEIAVREIAEAQNHPYLKAALEVKATLDRRESLMKTLDDYQRMDTSYLKLSRKKLPPYKTFLKDYAFTSRPGLFKGAVDHWPAMKWTPRNLVGKVGADTEIEVQQGREGDSNYEMNSYQHKRRMRFSDFIDQVENNVTNDIYLTANNHAFGNTAVTKLASDVGNIGDGYLDAEQTAQRMFLWIGPKGIITPLHHDLTHNLFVQIYGKKRFRLIPALQVPFMYNHRHVFCRVDLLDPKPQTYPQFSRATPIDITLEAGDFLYIPPGWWHHVMGETTSISLSFTNLAQIPNRFVDYPAK